MCAMGGNYDALFQKEDMVAGVISGKDPVLAAAPFSSLDRISEMYAYYSLHI